jgi:hypothetical protein
LLWHHWLLLLLLLLLLWRLVAARAGALAQCCTCSCGS